MAEGRKREVKNQKSRVTESEDAMPRRFQDPDSLIRGLSVRRPRQQVLAGGWPTKSLNV
jgi:hypothetical protein